MLESSVYKEDFLQESTSTRSSIVIQNLSTRISHQMNQNNIASNIPYYERTERSTGFVLVLPSYNCANSNRHNPYLRVSPFVSGHYTDWTASLAKEIGHYTVLFLFFHRTSALVFVQTSSAKPRTKRQAQKKRDHRTPTGERCMAEDEPSSVEKAKIWREKESGNWNREFVRSASAKCV